MKSPRIPSRKTVYLIGAATAVTLALLLVTSLSLRVHRLNATVASISTGLSDELERQNRLTRALESNQRTATGELREVRSLLNLPAAEYRFPDGDSGRDATPDPERAFFRAVDRLRAYHQHRRLRRDVAYIIENDSDIAALLNEFELRTQPGSRTGTWEVAGTSTVVTLRVTGTTPPARIEVVPLQGDQREIRYTEDAGELAEQLRTVLSQTIRETIDYVSRYRQVRETLLRSLESSSVRSAADSLDLDISSREEAFPIAARVDTADGRTLLQVDIDPHSLDVLVDGEVAPAEVPLADYLADRVAALDPRPEEERAEDLARRRILEIAGDPAFSAYLDQAGFSIDRDPRETLDFHVFDLRDNNGNPQGSLAVLKNSGEIYLLDHEDVMITGLQSLQRDPEQSEHRPVSRGGQARELPADFPPGFRGGTNRDGTDILLVGSHETKADSIILVHLSPERTISMVTIPRDIYFQDRKLSDHYEIYGTRSFLSRINELTGRSIDGYVIVDMYAFIEMVDVLGGITMTLDEPLVDPTYRVRDAGEWGTLHYAAGTHTLNGIEALRIARSRATTTDFGRGSRQLEMLEALRRRVNELHAGNLDQVYQLIRTLHTYVDTDLSAWDLTQYFLAYRNAPIVNRAGMTFHNVLYSTYSNVHHQEITFEEAEEKEDFHFGLWILLPRGDDWGVIPWFIEQNLNP